MVRCFKYCESRYQVMIAQTRTKTSRKVFRTRVMHMRLDCFMSKYLKSKSSSHPTQERVPVVPVESLNHWVPDPQTQCTHSVQYEIREYVVLVYRTAVYWHSEHIVDSKPNVKNLQKFSNSHKFESSLLPPIYFHSTTKTDTLFDNSRWSN